MEILRLNKHRDEAEEDDSSVASLASLAVKSLSSVTSTATRGLSHWRIVLFGQFLALVLALRGALNTVAYRECNLSVPAFQIAIMYGMLMFHLFYFAVRQDRMRREGKEKDNSSIVATIDTPQTNFNEKEHMSENGLSTIHTGFKLPFTTLFLSKPWWFYMIVALLDVEANYLSYLALRFTSFKSAALMSCLAIPSAITASYFLLQRRYDCVHLFGALVCMVGATIAMLSDYDEVTHGEDAHVHRNLLRKRSEYPNAVLGDVLAAIGGFLYGILDALFEMALKTTGQAEFFGMLGLFGFVIASVQVVVFEIDAVVELFSDASSCTSGGTALLLYGAIVATFYVFYLGVGRFLVVSEAALLNLSLLTSDVLAALFSAVLQHEVPTNLFYASLVMVVFGVFIYETAPSPIVDTEGNKEKNIKSADLPTSFDVEWHVQN